MPSRPGLRSTWWCRHPRVLWMLTMPSSMRSLTVSATSFRAAMEAKKPFTPPAVLNEENLINQIAASLGISANFATGDSGDFTFDIGPPDFPPTVLAPADSPYATGVGGVSLALKLDGTMRFQTGWGNNETLARFWREAFSIPPSTSASYMAPAEGPVRFSRSRPSRKNCRVRTGSFRTSPGLPIHLPEA